MPWCFKYPFDILVSMQDTIELGPPNAAGCSLCAVLKMKKAQSWLTSSYIVVSYKHTKVHVHLLHYCFHALYMSNMFKHEP